MSKKDEGVTDEERKIAKSIVFGQMYGRSVEGYATPHRIGWDESSETLLRL